MSVANEKHSKPPWFGMWMILAVAVFCTALAAPMLMPGSDIGKRPEPRGAERSYMPRQPIDTSGYSMIVPIVKPWGPEASLEEIAGRWRDASRPAFDWVEDELHRREGNIKLTVQLLIMKAALYNSEGDAATAGRVLGEARALVVTDRRVEDELLPTVIFFQGVTALRRGENDNCVMCRGESSCIVPIATSAIHLKPGGSREAIGHFKDYLKLFPDDLGVQWLLNVAHMTLGEHPSGVDPKYVLRFNRFSNSEFDIGVFRDCGAEVGANRFNQAGGAIMDDFDNDGLLDLFTTAFDPTESAAFLRNTGKGGFEDRSEGCGLKGQYGGLVCYQADYDNDGKLDVFIPRGAWLQSPIRPSLLRNTGKGFEDVTVGAGLSAPLNSNSANWVDFDNDGLIDLFIACESQPNRLYRNRGDGTFESVSDAGGLAGKSGDFAKGSTWFDYDNDGLPDVFINNLGGEARLYKNLGAGRFKDVTRSAGVQGPAHGFSCWSWDFDNDGLLDIFATNYERTLDEVVAGIFGRPNHGPKGRLYRNIDGSRFEDVTTEAGVDLVYASMGSNFADFDNDGFLDFYLGTGEPSFATLIPNRMFLNVGGERFSEITGSSRTGHLQKGHGVACGDWDRDGDIDLFIQTGGAVNGDKYHNLLFQNPGQGRKSVTLRLIGKKTNRSAIGARIKAIIGGAQPRSIHRVVGSGSSFGANTLEQTIGLGSEGKIDSLEIDWPTSGTRQTFRDIAAGRVIRIEEFADRYETTAVEPTAKPETK